MNKDLKIVLLLLGNILINIYFLYAFFKYENFLYILLALIPYPILRYYFKEEFTEPIINIKPNYSVRSTRKGRIIKCPQCKSKRIKILGIGDKMVSGTMGGLIAGPIGVIAGVYETSNKFKCMSCGHWWKSRRKVESS